MEELTRIALLVAALAAAVKGIEFLLRKGWWGFHHIKDFFGNLWELHMLMVDTARGIRDDLPNGAENVAQAISDLYDMDRRLLRDTQRIIHAIEQFDRWLRNHGGRHQIIEEELRRLHPGVLDNIEPDDQLEQLPWGEYPPTWEWRKEDGDG